MRSRAERCGMPSWRPAAPSPSGRPGCSPSTWLGSKPVSSSSRSTTRARGTRSSPSRAYSPFEIGLGRLVNFSKAAPFTGRAALQREVDRGGPARRLVGLTLDWDDLERLYAGQGLSPAAVGAGVARTGPALCRRVGRSGGRPAARGARRSRRTSRWRPSMRRWSRPARVSRWSGPSRAGAGASARLVVPLPFFDPERKRA